jgi:predicted nucleic acid-binding protein
MVVLDASTLILIARAELLEVFLNGVTLAVAVPVEVERERCTGRRTLDGLMIRKAVEESRIEVIAVDDRKLVSKLRADFNLAQGEAEALALSLIRKARLLGIDDKNGINACKLLGIAFTTAVGILIRSREKGLVRGPEALAKLTILAKHGRYKESIIEDARLKLEGQP